jgi:hypothetical protein
MCRFGIDGNQRNHMSQKWALLLTANKASGVFPVCKATRQLHLKDGTLHLHGHRVNRCPHRYWSVTSNNCMRSYRFSSFHSTSSFSCLQSDSSCHLQCSYLSTRLFPTRLTGNAPLHIFPKPLVSPVLVH